MLLRDLTYAGRTLRKSPVFAVTAVATIALGIGVSTAIFSVTNAVLLRPLRYKNPDRLVLALGEFKKRSVTDWPFSNANFLDLRDGAKTMFEDFTAVTAVRTIFPREDGTPEQVRIATVTPNFFGVLGARIALGRDFMDADGQQTNAAPDAQAIQHLPAIAILSYEYWQRRYGGDPAILKRGIRNGPQVVGVLV